MRRTLMMFVCMIALAVQTSAGIIQSEQFGYTVNPDGVSVTIVKGNNVEGDLVIPSELREYSVTQIGASAFQGLLKLTSVTIPGSVTQIGTSAFQSCEALQSVTILDGVTQIGARAFESCKAVQSVTIPGSVSSIGENAFQGCSALQSVTIPDGVTQIGKSAFQGCSALQSVTIPASMTSLGDNAFSGCSALKELTSLSTVPNESVIQSLKRTSSLNARNITLYVPAEAVNAYKWIGSDFAATIGLLASGDGWRLTDDGTLTISKNFEGDSRDSYPWDSNRNDIKSVEFSEDVTIIGDWAFSYCVWLESLEIPDRVTSIGDYALYQAGLTGTLNIPSSVTHIGEFAFASCTRLTGELKIPSSVTSIGMGVSMNCKLLTGIVVDKDNSKYDSRDNCNAIIETETNTLIAGCNNTTLPSSVTCIGDYSLSSCSGLTGTLTIPSNVTRIGDSAFENCTGLTAVVMPEGLTTIGSDAFVGCETLTSIVIPSTVTSIGDAFSNCFALTSVTCLVTSPVELSDFTFYRVDLSNATLYVPQSALDAYKSADIWKNFGTTVGVEKSLASGDGWTLTEDGTLTVSKDIAYASPYDYPWDANRENIKKVVFAEGVTAIGDDAFYYCTELTSVVIPEGVTSIDAYAFYNCKSLTSLELPSSLTSIGDCSFQGCDALASIVVGENNKVFDSRDNCNAIIVTETNTLIFGCKNSTIPSTVTSIGESAFGGCSGLTTIDIPSNVTSIGEYAFLNCSDLTNLVIHEGVTSIGSGAFRGCSGLTKIDIPSSVTSIGTSVFQSCTALTNMVIPEGVTSIGESAFFYCTALTTIDIPASVTSIGESAFFGCSDLKNVTVSSTTPVELPFSVFMSVDFSNVTLYVPQSALDAYKSADIWMYFGKIEALPEPVVTSLRPVASSSPSSSSPDTSWTDLSGRKLSAKPSAPGLYIHAGKKVLIK